MFDPFPRSTKKIWVTKMDVGTWQGVCHWKQQPQQNIRKWVVNGLHRHISRRYNTVANHWLSWSIIPVCSVSAWQVTLRYPSEHFLIIVQIFLEILVRKWFIIIIIIIIIIISACSWLVFFAPNAGAFPFSGRVFLRSHGIIGGGFPVGDLQNRRVDPGSFGPAGPANFVNF